MKFFKLLSVLMFIFYSTSIFADEDCENKLDVIYSAVKEQMAITSDNNYKHYLSEAMTFIDTKRSSSLNFDDCNILETAQHFIIREKVNLDMNPSSSSDM